MPTRRTFLMCGAAAIAGSVSATRPALAAPFWAPRPKSIKRVGLQLYTLREPMSKDFQGSLEQVAKLGYKEVEFAGYYNHTPKQVKDLLSSLGLSAPSTHTSLKAMREEWARTLDDAKAVGHEYIVLAWLPPDERKTIDQYRKLADLLNTSAEAAKAKGLQMAYHNHDFEFMPIDGTLPYDLLVERTDPKLVKLELDLYWIVKAGGDPLAYFAKQPGRFPLVHVKDMDSTPAKGFAEVGRGTIDFKSIFAKAGQGGIKHYFVEQDQTPGSPFDSIKISIDNLRAMKI